MKPTPMARLHGAALAIALATTVGGIAACGESAAHSGGETAPPPTASPIGAPAPANSAEPNLAVGPDGIYLTWLERTDGARHALRFARWDGNGWSEPLLVMERAGLFVNWADFPSMAVMRDGTLAAHWLQRSGPGPYAYDVRIALSGDGGVSWSDDIVPHRDGVQTEHGFVSMFPLDDGLGAVWLDGREMPDGGPMTLRSTTIGPDGELGEEVVLDPMICECCQTGVAMTTAGPVVAYRGRTDGEIRDIYVTRFTDGEWSAPRTVHDDGWVIPGCPVNGPAIAADGDRVVVAWFTGAPDRSGEAATRADVRRMGESGRVLAAVSRDGGASFAEPIRIDDGEAMGRAGVVMLDDGEALVTWLERTDDAAEIRVRRIGASGRPGPSAALAVTAAARASGFPRVARYRDSILFAWTEAGEIPAVRTAIAPVHGNGDRVTVAGGSP